MSQSIRHQSLHAHSRGSTLCPLVAGLAAAVGVAAAAQAQGLAGPGLDHEVVYWDAADAEGRLSGGMLFLPKVEIDPGEVIPGHAETLWDPTAGMSTRDGALPERLDIVLVGDGYRAAQLGQYAVDVDYAVSELFAQEPFRTYQNLFRVHRVDVASADSGVDHDPSYPIYRDTALDMEFWCDGIERALCVDVSKAWAHARAAPQEPDQVLAVANTLKYGGVGYPGSDLATVAGGNFWAPEVALHEFGHSIGNLADEYDYGGGVTWPFGEPADANASTYTATEMTALGQKWHRWIGVNDPAWDGRVNTFEGCYYYQTGINRPTYDSKMRNLGRPFNLPSAEALIFEFYREVRPIDDATPAGAPLSGDETVYVQPVKLVGHSMDVQWYLNDQPIPGATGATLDLTTVALAGGLNKLRATVTDNTPWVRDEDRRAELMTESRQWAVEGDSCYPDCDASGGLDFFDFLCFQTRFAAGEATADCDDSGDLDFFDFLCFQAEFAAGCP